jgi:CoA-transferase family III
VVDDDGADPGGHRAADWARSGVVALTGRPEGPPLVPPGDGATVASRVAARLATATGGSDHPVRVDGAALLAERAAYTGHRRRGMVSAGGLCRLLPTADGWAAVSCARPDDPPLLGALIGAELTADPWPGVAAWLRTHTGAELAERAALLGLAAAPVDGAGATPVDRAPTATAHEAGPLPAHEAGRTPVDRAPTAAAREAGPLPIHEAGPTPGPPIGPLRSPEGLLVVDFSALWAGPLCAHLLGLGGARVVKVETPQRLDGARRGHPEFYRLLHAGHRAVLLDPDTAGGRRALAALVAAADIVIEASRPRALARFGLDAETAAGEGTIWVSITAAGRGSPRVGFGDDVAAGAGLVACDERGAPVFCGDALADPLTGLAAAELALTAPQDGRGRLFDVAMSGVAAATLTGPRRSPAVAARRDGASWVVDTPGGPVPLAAPRRRGTSDPASTSTSTPARAPAPAPAPGEHTAEVLRELRIPVP